MKHSKLYEQFSSPNNLKKAFLFLQQELNNTSLPTEPIHQPSLNAIREMGDLFFETLSKFLQEEEYIPDKPLYIFAPKSSIANRPVCICSLVDKIVYQALLNPDILGDSIDNKLSDFCYGNRIDGNKIFLKDYKYQWKKYCREQIKLYNEGFFWYAEFDIKSFYKDIIIDILSDKLINDFCLDKSLVDVLTKQLYTWRQTKCNLGIPQGSEASPILANAYLHSLDVIMNNLQDGSFRFMRYVDDMVIMAKTKNKVNELIEEINNQLSELGLELNDKTSLRKMTITDLEKIKEKMFFNPYDNSSAYKTNMDKIRNIEKNLPNILKKLKDEDRDVTKTDISQLKYYLKAVQNNNNIDRIVEIIPNPRVGCIIHLIARYIDKYFEKVCLWDRETDNTVFNRMIEIYNKKHLSWWVKFWVVKILSIPNYSMTSVQFDEILQKIPYIKNSGIMKLATLFHYAYRGKFYFRFGDIKKMIDDSKAPVEAVSYCYFLIYVASKDNDKYIKDTICRFSESESIDKQIIAIYLANKLNFNIRKTRLGKFAMMFYGIHLKQGSESKENTHEELIDNSGKVAQGRLAGVLGLDVPFKVEITNISEISNSFKKQTQTKKSENNTFLFQDEKGKFYLNRKPIVFSGENSNHYWLLNCLYNNSDAMGFCSYQDIINYLKSKGNKNAGQRTIDNAKGQLFQRAKVNNKPIENKLFVEGSRLIETVRASGLKLNNISI